MIVGYTNYKLQWSSQKSLEAFRFAAARAACIAKDMRESLSISTPIQMVHAAGIVH